MEKTCVSTERRRSSCAPCRRRTAEARDGHQQHERVEVSIQALSPLLNASGCRAGGAASAAGGVAAASSARRWREVEQQEMPSSVQIRAPKPRTDWCLERHGSNSCLDFEARVQSAAVSVSPVRMRTAVSRPRTKILPSPIWPVLAAVVMVSMALSTWSVGNRHLDLHLRQEGHRVFGAAIDFGMALLTPVALDLGDGHPVHPDRGQSVADLVELEWLDDRHDDFHGFNPRLARSCAAGWGGPH